MKKKLLDILDEFDNSPLPYREEELASYFEELAFFIRNNGVASLSIDNTPIL